MKKPVFHASRSKRYSTQVLNSVVGVLGFSNAIAASDMIRHVIVKREEILAQQGTCILGVKWNEATE